MAPEHIANDLELAAIHQSNPGSTVDQPTKDISNCCRIIKSTFSLLDPWDITRDFAKALQKPGPGSKRQNGIKVNPRIFHCHSLPVSISLPRLQCIISLKRGQGGKHFSCF